MNLAASHLVNRCSEQLYKTEGFYRQDGTKQSERKKRKDYFRPGREQQGFY